MDTARAARIQVALEGVPLPATRRMLVEYLAHEEPELEGALDVLPEREYERLDEVGDALLHPDPPPSPPKRAPRAESGEPPGGASYTDPRADEHGRVRRDWPPTNPPQQTIEQQSTTQNRQQERQGS